MNLVILWHMHQPYYVNPQTKMALMPWVRLHAVKGYLDMIDVLEATPQIRTIFNLTPVLVKQILELANGEVTDLWESWSRKPPEALHREEKKRILENFFKINWDNMIRPYPRYQELLERRGYQWDESSLESTVDLFQDGDWRDLQTWYNLAWCGFSAVTRFPELADLREQGRGFSEGQKHRVLDIHSEILRLLLPRYRQALAARRIEITTTPFFHPIMPLVYDTDLARRCMPGQHLPKRFTAPEDVQAHLQLAQEQHAQAFGERAKGLWPSEGSVAPELIPLFAEEGFEYFCTDEGNLFASLPHDPAWQGRHIDHLELFQGWRVEGQGAAVNALFRERPLSDFIGFNAARNSPDRSAAYLLHQIDHLDSVIPDSEGRGCLCLALDGENCWEHFHDGGQDFLQRFYSGIAQRPAIRTTTLARYFAEHPPIAQISTLHTGSWMNSDFDIWIGEPEENRGWELIGSSRRFLIDELANRTDISQETARQAWWEIYAAEGSDWFWWYGPDVATECDFLFDDLFRTHLQNVYRVLDRQPPAELEVAICAAQQPVAYLKPRERINPPLNGRLRSYYDWLGAGKLDITTQGTAMFQADRLGKTLYFGYATDAFVLRLDSTRCPTQLVVIFIRPHARRLSLEATNGNLVTRLESSDDGVTFSPLIDPVRAHWGDYLVVSIPLTSLGWDNENNGNEAGFFVQLLEGDLTTERYPERGALGFPLPGPDFEAKNWFV